MCDEHSLPVRDRSWRNKCPESLFDVSLLLGLIGSTHLPVSEKSKEPPFLFTDRSLRQRRQWRTVENRCGEVYTAYPAHPMFLKSVFTLGKYSWNYKVNNLNMRGKKMLQFSNME